MINPHVFQFPVMLLGDIIHAFGSAMVWFRKSFGMKFVSRPLTNSLKNGSFSSCIIHAKFVLFISRF